MIEPFFQTATCRTFGNKTNYLRKTNENVFIRKDTVIGTRWCEITYDEFTRDYYA